MANSLHEQGIVDILDPRIVNLNNQLEYWKKIKEDFHKQRAKDDNIKVEDINTCYSLDRANFRKKKLALRLYKIVMEIGCLPEMILLIIFFIILLI